MKPIITVEFEARAANQQFREESVTLDGPDALFGFIAPGGGCERIPDGIEEVRLIFTPPKNRNAANPVADLPVMLQLHAVILTGPLAAISQTAEGIIDRAGRGELSESFMRAIGAAG